MKEPLFRCWFRYVYGQQGKLVQLGDNAYEQVVEPTFTDYPSDLVPSGGTESATHE